MTDVFTKTKRSDVMAQIRGRGNKSTELRLISFFKTYQIKGWRRGSALIGKPDFIFIKHKLAIFVDGCFWHGCPLHATSPKSNIEFWREKIAGNIKRDRLVVRTLRKKGWRVIRIWEHELAQKRTQRLIVRFRRAGLNPLNINQASACTLHKNQTSTGVRLKREPRIGSA